MDVLTRRIRGWHLGRELDHSLTVTTLALALAHAAPKIHHSDQGGRYACSDYTQLLVGRGIAPGMSDVGEAWQNPFAERVIRTIKEEEVDLSDYQDLSDAYRQVGNFIDRVYDDKCIPSALGYLTPVEFEEPWRAEEESLQPQRIG